ncbi:MAG: hypothetical protein AAF989_10570, partial [Planctomycetota bacterium]
MRRGVRAERGLKTLLTVRARLCYREETPLLWRPAVNLRLHHAGTLASGPLASPHFGKSVRG